MELLEAIKTRRSIREFIGQHIPDEHIEIILDVAGYAPSPKNPNVALHSHTRRPRNERPNSRSPHRSF